MAPSGTGDALHLSNGHATKKNLTTSNFKNGQKIDVSTRTDYSRWRLRDIKGRQTWHYLETDEAMKDWPQSTVDKYFLGLPTVRCSTCVCKLN